MNKHKLIYIFLLLILAVFGYTLGYGTKYISALEIQIQKRDSLLAVLSQSENNLRVKETLLNQLVEYKIDSLGTITYSGIRGFEGEMLNYDDMKSYIMDHKTFVDSINIYRAIVKKLEDVTTASHKITSDNGKINIDIKYKSVNEAQFKEMNDELNIMLKEYTIIKTFVDLINVKYDITYSATKYDSNEQNYVVKAIAPKIDSALILLDKYRDKMHYDVVNQSWKVD